jgi:O-antigen/teichoic acid export membrane protein
VLENKSSYLQIVKTTSLFGGVQFFNMLISIIRTKLIAVFIGPEGMGVISLLTAALGIIGGTTGIGIETSAVKHVAGNFKKDDLNSVATTVSIVKKLVLFSGIFGAFITIVCSRYLSLLTFGNTDYTFSFVFLSFTVLLRQLMIGELVVLQGLRRMKLLAKANFYGNLFGLLFSIPLYVIYRIDAIVPTIIIAAVSSLLFSLLYSRKIKFEKSTVSNKQLTTEGKSIIRLGILLTLSAVLTLLSTYLIQLYIGKNGGLVEVGYFNAGFTLLNSYVGIIFTVMSTDYFPRLASITNDNEKIRDSVVQQSFVSILIITPIIILFLALVPLIIKIIYTPAFVSIIPMVSFGILAMLFRAVSWSMGYILIAKGDSKIFIKTAIGFNILSLILNIIGYKYYGLEGLGFSFLLYYLFHFFVLKIITKKRYNFYFNNDFNQIYLSCILMCMTMFLFRYIPNIFLKHSLMVGMTIFSFAFVLFQMNKKLELKEFFSALKNKKND